MPLLVNSVPNLIQGVSQQPDSLRHPSQCEEQINAFSSVVDGLIKRQSTEFVGKISDDTSNASSLFTHFVKRDEDTKYCVTVSLGGVGVFNLSLGTHIPVAVTSIAGSYLSLGSSVTNPLTDLRALTVADYTFLVNKKRVVEKENHFLQKSTPPSGRASYVLYNGVTYKCIETHTSTSPFDATKWEEVSNTTTNDKWLANTVYSTGVHEAIIAVKLGDYGKHYSIYLDNSLINFNQNAISHGQDHIGDHTPDDGDSEATYKSGGADEASHADTIRIAKDLKALIEDHVTNTTGISSLTLNNTAPTWAAGIPGQILPLTTGEGNRTVDIAVDIKVTCTLSQTGVNDPESTALLNINFLEGNITGFSFLRRGSGFNPNSSLQQEFRTYYRVIFKGKAREWIESSTQVDNTVFNVTQALVTANSDFNVEVKGSLIKLTNTKGPFKIRTEDGLADQGLGVVYREVNSITDLPDKCYNNFRVKVIGDADINQDDYYVRFSTKEKEEFGEGTWVETVGYYQDESPGSIMEGIDTLLVNSTMPVTLVPFFKNGEINDFRLQTPNELLIVKQGTSYYLLKKDHAAANSNKPGVGADWEDFWTEVPDATQGYLDWELDVYYYGPTDTTSRSFGWAGRAAGDDFTNPFPSFVGKTINDIFFFKNRLGLLTDSNVIFSEADEYYNFFRTTTQQLLDSAPIDVGLSHTKVAILKHAKAFQEKLMLFSDTSQFVLRGQDVLSPKTVAISPVSEYDVSDQVEPLALGNYIYFPFKRDNYEGMYEYFVDNNTEVFTAQEITEQVPRYIRSNVQRMAGSPIQNVICLKSDRGTEQDTLYVYKYFWSNNEKVQSAWQKFEFGHCTNICGFEFIDSTLYMLNHVGDVLQLEKLSFEDGHTETIHGFHSYRGDLGYPILLDSKIAQGLSAYTTQSYDALTNKTTISDVDIYIPESNESYELQLWTMNGAKYDITKGSEIPDELVHDGITYTAVDSGPSGLKVEIYPSPSSDMTYNSGTKTLVISLPSPITDRTQGDIKALYDAASANETDVFNLSFSDPNANLTSYLLDPTPLIRVSDSSFTVDGPIYDYVSYEGTIYKCILSHNSSLYPETSVRERRVGDPDPLKPGGTQSLWTTLSGDEAVLVTSAPEWQEDRWYQGPYEFVIGYAYGMLYRFSKQTLKQPTERGGRTKSDYTFQTIRTGSLEYSGSGAMQVEVYPKFRDPKRYPFNPTNLGSDSIINKFTPESGHFRFPIQTQAEELRLEVKNSSALPLRLLSAEFESMVVSRSKRYGA
jgi:hypothetical protein